MRYSYRAISYACSVAHWTFDQRFPRVVATSEKNDQFDNRSESKPKNQGVQQLLNRQTSSKANKVAASAVYTRGSVVRHIANTIPKEQIAHCPRLNRVLNALHGAVNYRL
jgi:hypothetical protein